MNNKTIKSEKKMNKQHSVIYYEVMFLLASALLSLATRPNMYGIIKYIIMAAGIVTVAYSLTKLIFPIMMNEKVELV
jgi:hypothetical protein